MSMDYICGKKVVMDAIEQGAEVKYVWLQRGYEKIIEKCHNAGIPFEVMKNGDKFFKSKVGRANHQGVMAEVEPFKYYELKEVITLAKSKSNPLVVITDGIEDPGNLGAILRTCDATNVDAVILKNHGQVKVNPLVAKISAGAAQNVPICIVNNVTETIKKMQKEGFWSVGTALGNIKQTHWDMDYDFPTLLVIGNEKDGISRLVLENCDYKVQIPMLGKVESLNVSVATAVMLYEIRRSQLKK